MGPSLVGREINLMGLEVGGGAVRHWDRTEQKNTSVLYVLQGAACNALDIIHVFWAITSDVFLTGTK